MRNHPVGACQKTITTDKTNNRTQEYKRLRPLFLLSIAQHLLAAERYGSTVAEREADVVRCDSGLLRRKKHANVNLPGLY